jgi:hypothetical protein
LASDVEISSEFCAAKENKEIIKGPNKFWNVGYFLNGRNIYMGFLLVW